MWLNWISGKTSINIFINSCSTIGDSCQKNTGAPQLNQHKYPMMNCKIPSCILTNVLSWESRWFYLKPFLISNGRQSTLGPLVHSNFPDIYMEDFHLFSVPNLHQSADFKRGFPTPHYVLWPGARLSYSLCSFSYAFQLHYSSLWGSLKPNGPI